jgi:type IV secretion system protein VirB10
MSDRIPSIVGNNKDRSTLNVVGLKKNRKKLFAFVCLIISVILIISIALIIVVNKIESNKKPSNEIGHAETNVTEKNKSAIEHDGAWFAQAKRKIIEKEKPDPVEEKPIPVMVKVEPKPFDVETVKPTPKVIITRTSRTPKPKPEPKPEPKPKPKVEKTKPELTARQRKMMGSLSGGDGRSPNISTGSDSGGLFGGSDYSDSFNSPLFEPGTASLRKRGTLDFLLKHGSSVPCALYTQIISDYQGFVTCRVTQDVYSANGSVLLIEKGSLVSGSQSVALEAGKSRVFTTWADIETPTGVSVRIDSFGTGSLGASGNEVWVDNHYAEKFGGAIMLSFVDDALSTISRKIAGGVISTDSTTQSVGDMANTALESTINISPTGYAHIGQRINILIARDIDMSSIYQLTESN